MNYKNKYQRGFAVAAVLVIVIAAGIGAVVWMASRQSFSNSGAISPVVTRSLTPTGRPSATTFPANDVTSQVPAITNKADLSNRLRDLDNTNVDEVQKKLFENDSDVSKL